MRGTHISICNVTAAAAILAASCSTVTGVQPALSVRPESSSRAPLASPTPYIYVGNYYGADVTVYQLTANGNAAPYHTIVGAFTGLDHPSAIAIDSTGQIYVGNYLIVGADIEVFAAGSNGDAAPVKILSGPQNFDISPNEFAIDPTDDLYVAETPGRIDVFAPDATATSAPIRSIAGPDTKLVQPSGVALDAAQHVFVCDTTLNKILEFATGADGDAKPIRQISGKNTGLKNPDGIAVDGVGRLYVSQQNGHDVEEFAAGVKGNVAPAHVFNAGAERPTSIGVRGARVYVTEISVPIYFYGIDVLETGSLQPVHFISGSATGLDYGDAVTAR